MMKKKGLSPVVANVLIILLVIAAVAIVWAVVRSAIDNASGEFESGANCLPIAMEVQSCTIDGTTSAVSVSVIRNSGGPDAALGFRIIGDEGNTFDAPPVNALVEANSTVVAAGVDAFNSGEAIQIAPELPNGDFCPAIGQPVTCN